MNPATLAEAKEIANASRLAATKIKNTEIVICPPFIYLQACSNGAGSDNFHLGAQNLAALPAGLQTGEVSAAMLKDLGVKYSIVGHSERRAKGETDEIVAQKLAQALEAGITPIVCIGEKNRDDENGSHFDFLKEQLKNSLGEVAKKYVSDLIIAYEPIWAIGALAAMNPDQIYETMLFIKKTLADLFGQDYSKKTRIIYGGSANATNAADIVRLGQVDGLLPGRESLSKSGFGELLRAVDEVA